MNKREFVVKWRHEIAGLALFGMVSDVRDSTMQRAARALDIPQQVQALLARMYDDLACDGETPPPGEVKVSLAGNGRGPGAAAHTNGRR